MENCLDNNPESWNVVGMQRLIETYIFDPEMTAGKMIFLTGPRQIGKTTFAKMWLESKKSEATYFNWDDPAVIIEYKKNPLFFHNVIDENFKNEPVPLVFDEIHKHKEWRAILKGIFDTNRDKMKLLVTGSARLEFLRKSGDSLLGRYFSYRILPLGLPEIAGDFSPVLYDDASFTDSNILVRHAREAKRKGAEEGLELLMKFGGFPEPFLKGSERFHRRWQAEYKKLLTKEDVRDFSRISDIKGLEILVEILPAKVGSNLSTPSLSQDLDRKYDTIKNWLSVLQSLYLVFTIMPWHRRINRAIKKEKKLYFYDWTMVSDPGRRYENLIAVALLKMSARFTETGLGNYELRYIRDREKKEVDFVMIKDNEPVALFEAKKSETIISRSGRFYSEKLNIPLFQIVQQAKKIEAFPGNCFVIPASNFLMLTG